MDHLAVGELSFTVVSGLADARRYSLQAAGISGTPRSACRCVRHRNFPLWVDTYDITGAIFPAGSSFNVLNPCA